MTNPNQSLSILQQACTSPRGRLEHYLKQGKKVVGCFPYYAPEGPVHACEVIPVGVQGGQTEWKLAGGYLPAFACPITQSNMEFGLRDTYEDMSAVITPVVYDMPRCITQNWRFGVPSIPMISIVQPQSRTSPADVDYLISEFETVLVMLYTITDRMINEAALGRTVQIYNEYDAVMWEFSAMAVEHLDVITPKVRHTMMKSASFYGEHEHTAIVREVMNTFKQRPGYSYPSKKIILSGITCEPDELLDILTEDQFVIIEDGLAQEMRQYRTDVPLRGGGDLKRLALQWGNRCSCSLIYTLGKPRGGMMVSPCRETEAEGVILYIVKFCDPEEYDKPYLEADLQQADIPSLSIKVDQQNDSFEQLRTRLQAFRDTMQWQPIPK